MTENMNKVILMIALDFPPCQSAGVQRTLKFAEYLSTLGWQPIVLTVNENVHQRVDYEQLIPKSIKVYRCHALDASRDLAIKGKYFGWSKVPDKWWSWALTAIPLGKKLIKKYQPAVIWSTYPISTAHYIAYKLQKRSRIPWVADYRDPLQCRYDSNVQQYSAVAKWIEKRTIENCYKAVFTTSRAAQLYHRLYPDELLKKFKVIENGFDEANFNSLTTDVQNTSHKFVLLHSGSVYENGRDPTALFAAIQQLKQNNVIDETNFILAFRGAVNNGQFDKKLAELGIRGLVEFRAMLPYKESLKEMMTINALVLIQDSLFENQIPGKAYEYIRTNKPILGITKKMGATGELLENAQGCVLAVSVDEIATAIKTLLNSSFTSREDVMKYSRYAKTQELALLLNQIGVERE